MAKRSQYGTQGQKRRGVMPEGVHMSCSPAWKGTPKEGLSYKQLERVFESSPDSMLVYDRNEKIIQINAQALLLFETSSDSWKGKSREQFLQDYQPSDPWQQPTPALLWLMNLIKDDEAGSGSPEQTLTLHMPSGRQVYVNHWHVPLFDERRHTLGSFSVFHNITHRYQKALHLQRVHINDLIDDAQIQTNRFTLHMNHYDLLVLLKDAVSQQQRSVSKGTIILNILPTEQRVPIFADAERITRVLNTYLLNALNHSPREAPVTVQLLVADTQALVSVRDEGPGIAADEQEHLWERFYRAKGSAVQHELDLSFGLGFYLCRVIIEHHHGHVGVQSSPGQGETFWFTLPVAAYSEQ